MPHPIHEMSQPPGGLPLGRKNVLPTGRNWHVAALMVACGCSTRKISLYTGIGAPVIAKWRMQPKFKEYVNRVHNETIEQCVGYLRMVTESAARRLHELLKSQDERIALGAVKEVREAYHFYKSHLDNSERIARLEQLLPHLTGQDNHEQHSLPEPTGQPAAIAGADPVGGS